MVQPLQPVQRTVANTSAVKWRSCDNLKTGMTAEKFYRMSGTGNTIISSVKGEGSSEFVRRNWTGVWSNWLDCLYVVTVTVLGCVAVLDSTMQLCIFKFCINGPGSSAGHDSLCINNYTDVFHTPSSCQKLQRCRVGSNKARSELDLLTFLFNFYWHLNQKMLRVMTRVHHSVLWCQNFKVFYHFSKQYIKCVWILTPPLL